MKEQRPSSWSAKEASAHCARAGACAHQDGWAFLWRRSQNSGAWPRGSSTRRLGPAVVLGLLVSGPWTGAGLGLELEHTVLVFTG